MPRMRIWQHGLTHHFRSLAAMFRRRRPEGLAVEVQAVEVQVEPAQASP